jgi:prefoldin subunit 5
LKATSAPATNTTVTNNLSETINSLSEELKEEKKRHETAQKQIEEKYQASVQMMNKVWRLVKQVQQTQEMTVCSMSEAMNQVMFPTCGKSTEILQLVIKKLQARVRNIELDDVTELINNQLSHINEAYKEFDRHQEELKTISSKQNEAVVLAMDNLFQQINE